MTQPKNTQPSNNGEPATITSAEATARIEARLAGTLSDTALARWAFDRFYAEELGEEEYEEGAEDVLGEVLDALMFGDDPNFRLSDDELRDLIVQLQEQ